MNFIADESLDFPIIAALRGSGYTVYSIMEKSPGTDDETVLKIASDQAAPLITKDKDFGELIYRLRKITSGVVLIRLDGLAKEQQIPIVLSAINDHAKELSGAFTVITSNSIRIRKLI